MPASSTPASGPARRGRPPQIRSEDILAAVTSRLGEDWTVTSVATQLGVSDAAIYRYFPSKKAILAAVADRLLADLSVPVYAGDARALLIELGRVWYALFVSNPSLLDLDVWVGIASTSGLASTEGTLDELSRAGFTLTDAASVLGALTATCREYARVTVLSNRAQVPPVVWDAKRLPTLSRTIATLPISTFGEAFEQALSVVVDGAMQRLPARRRASRTGKRS